MTDRLQIAMHILPSIIETFDRRESSQAVLKVMDKLILASLDAAGRMIKLDTARNFESGQLEVMNDQEAEMCEKPAYLRPITIC
jgi:hypothetical protein